VHDDPVHLLQGDLRPGVLIRRQQLHVDLRAAVPPVPGIRSLFFCRSAIHRLFSSASLKPVCAAADQQRSDHQHREQCQDPCDPAHDPAPAGSAGSALSVSIRVFSSCAPCSTGLRTPSVFPALSAARTTCCVRAAPVSAPRDSPLCPLGHLLRLCALLQEPLIRFSVLRVIEPVPHLPFSLSV